MMTAAFCPSFNAYPITKLEAELLERRLVLEATARASTLAGRSIALDAMRPQRRDGRGRFLSRAWLDAAESYSPSNLAWFRSPLSSEIG
jgi:hypothetical protein